MNNHHLKSTTLITYNQNNDLMNYMRDNQRLYIERIILLLLDRKSYHIVNKKYH